MRLKAVNPETLTAEQKNVYIDIQNGPRKGVRGPLAIWLHRPELAKRAQQLGEYCRYGSSLSPRLSELSILFMGRHWMAEYEWAAHKPFALEAGLDIDVINAIRDGKIPDFKNRDEELVYLFLDELHQQHQVSDGTYHAVRELLGETVLVDLVGIAGYYTLISMTIKVFEVPVPAGILAELK